jgi:hypothetical protein
VAPVVILVKNLVICHECEKDRFVITTNGTCVVISDTDITTNRTYVVISDTDITTNRTYVVISDTYIVLSVLQCTTSDNPFGFFKLFLEHSRSIRSIH